MLYTFYDGDTEIFEYTDISRSTKLLLLTLFIPQNQYYGTLLGDDCSPWLLKIAKLHDVSIELGHILKFPKRKNLNIHIVNSDIIVNNMRDYVLEAVKY